jgi:Rap1a immunity proteins
MKAIICSALMALLATTALAQQNKDSANYLLPACRAFVEPKELANVDPMDMALCLGTVLGLAHVAKYSVVSSAAFSGPGKSRAMKEHWRCVDIPSDASQAELMHAVVGYIEARPKRLHESFRTLALEGLFDAWPCKSG